MAVWLNIEDEPHDSSSLSFQTPLNDAKNFKNLTVVREQVSSCFLEDKTY